MLYYLILLVAASFCLAAPAPGLAKEHVEKSNSYGGPHGQPFDDKPPANARLEHVFLQGDKRLDAITLGRIDSKTFTHGGEGGAASYLPITWREGQYIKSAEVCWGKWKGHTGVFYAKVTRDDGLSIQRGTRTEDCSVISKPGYSIVGTFGRAGDRIDELGFYLRNVT